MNKNKNRKEYTKKEYLPDKLVKKFNVDILNKKYEYRTINNFLQCISIIYHYQIKHGIGLNDYVPLGSKYWKKLYGNNYYQRVIEPLLKNQVIESYDFGYRTFPNSSKNKNIGKLNGTVGIRYRINPMLLNNQFTSIPYIEKGKVFTGLERMHHSRLQFTSNGVPKINYHISIDLNKANDWVENNAERIINNYMNIDFINDLPDDLSIQYTEHLDSGYNTKYSSVKSAKFVASSKNKELFYFKDKFYIADTGFFINQRIPALIHHYKRQISQIGSMPIEEQRNQLTLRIYSHLTNFPSNILQLISINNNTVFQFDLRTSQFLIFANLLNVYIIHGEKHLLSLFKQKRTLTYLKRLIKILNAHKNQLPTVGIDINDINSGINISSDVIKFIRDVFYADFYSVVQGEMGFKERILAKYLVFKLLFKRTNRPDKLLNKLNVRYPILLNIITAFKTQKNSKIKSEDSDEDKETNFSVFLQCVEGEIYVDNILKQLRENDIPCFTRHDSIVVASGYEEKTEQIIKSVFENFGFRYNHKVEDKFWEVVDYDELEQSDYMQWLIDVNELEQNFFFDESYENSIENESENIYDLDEEHLEIIERLCEIGIRDNYYEYVDADFLEEIVLLPFLNEQQRNVLYDDINNLHDDMSYLQEDTNKLLKQLLSMDI